MSTDSTHWRSHALAADGVFCGGGIKGLAFAGALSATEQAGYREWRALAGTSAGAITAMALAIGYDARGLKAFLDRFDFKKIADYGTAIQLLGESGALIPRDSLADGDALSGWIRSMLEHSPLDGVGADTTFGELSALAPERTLVVIGCDVAHARMVEFPRDVHLYEDAHGEPLVPDSFPIHTAVRISAGFPYFFPPVGGLWDRSTKRQGVLLDGGVTSAFPTFAFDRPAPRHPTWGFRLHGGFDPGERQPSHRDIGGADWPKELLEGILDTAMNALDKFELRRFESRVIPIPTGAVSTLNFNLSKTEREYLYQSGFKAAKAFFTASPAAENSYGRLPGKEAPPA